MQTAITAEEIRTYKRDWSNWYGEYAELIRLLPISKRCDYKDEKKLLGEGAYGIVKLARTPNEGKLVVLKLFYRSIDEYDASTIREICFLNKLDHENILKLLDICCDGVLELCRCDLFAFTCAASYGEAHCKSIIQQILRGLSYIHRKKVLHRDLKPANILIGEDGKIKIADFGFARLRRSSSNEPYSPGVSTMGYRAPELMLGSQSYDESVDIFAAGVIFVELFVQEDLFPGDEKEVSKVMTRLLGKLTNEKVPGIENRPLYAWLISGLPEEQPVLREYLEDMRVPENAIIFASTLLQLNPAHRPKAFQALDNSYFTIDPQPNDNILELCP
ncbi:hypothetical protein Aperf_G00000081955 [Anoplocephala perfoliata]